MGGYTHTNEGKVIAASLMDNYNNVVKSVRNQPSLQRDVGSLADEAGKKVKGGAVPSRSIKTTRKARTSSS